MRYLFLILVVFIAIFIFNCGNSNPISSTINGTIFPLHVGNQWIYNLVLYDSTGAITASVTDSMVITKDTFFQNETWFAMDNNGTRAGLYMNSTGGTWGSNGISSFLVYKYPASIGDSYSGSVTVISINTAITVPAGDFNCYQYKLITGTNSYVIMSFAPNIGHVKDIFNSKTANGTNYVSATAELKSYILK